MKRTFIFIATISLLVGCQNDDVQPGAVLTGEAQVSTGSAVDLCDWTVRLTSNGADTTRRYAPDSPSVAKLDSFARAVEPSYLTFGAAVRLTYQLTGQRRTISCGRNSRPELDEIRVLQITKK